MAAATAIALSSCSSEETKDVAKSSNITFRSTVGLNSRGAEATTDNLKNIWVSAWADNDPVFNAEQFTKKAGTTEFRSVGGPWYWEKDKQYTFMAFATGKPTKENLNPTITKDNITLADYTPSANLADQLDLLVAQGTGSKVNNQTTGAKLDFDHILSQIQIKVKNTNENRKYIIKGVRISNVKGTATYTFTPGNVAAKHAWADIKTPSQYILNQDAAITLDDQNQVENLHTTKSEFSVEGLTELPKVGIVYGYSNCSPLPFKAFVDAKYAGIVLAGVGDGNFYKDVFDEALKARQKGILVVRSSRVPTGPTCLNGEVDDTKYQFVASLALNPQKARVLLMLALTKTHDWQKIQEYFQKY